MRDDVGVAADMNDSGRSVDGLSRRAMLGLAALGAGSLAFANLFSEALAARATPVWTAGWNAPLDATPPLGVNSPFLEGLAGYGYYDGVNYHLGLDLTASSHDSVHSIGSGVVLYVDPGQYPEEYPGTVVMIRHTAHDGTQFLGVYGHTNAQVAENQTVTMGQQIGSIYEYSSAHLHFGIRADTGRPARWGARKIAGNGGFHDGFQDPIPFLAAHPNSTTITPLDLGDEMPQMLFLSDDGHPDAGKMFLMFPDRYVFMGHDPNIINAIKATWGIETTIVGGWTAQWAFNEIDAARTARDTAIAAKIIEQMGT